MRVYPSHHTAMAIVRQLVQVLLLGGIALSPVLSAAGKLSRTRATVRGSSSSSSGSGGSGRSKSSSSSGLSLPPILACFTLPGALFCGPYFLLENHPDKASFFNKGRFRSYPYADGAPGHMVIQRPVARKQPPGNTTRKNATGKNAARKNARGKPASSTPDKSSSPENKKRLAGPGPPVPEKKHEGPAPPASAAKKKRRGRPVALRLSTEYSLDIDLVHRPSVYLQVDLARRFGLEAGWTHFMERLGDGNLDRLNIGDLNAFFRFAQSERAQFRVGIGLRLMVDELGTNPGFNFTYAFDVFPARPLVISASVDIGNLGWAFACHARATVGAMLRGRVELYAGYDALLVEPVLFHGPVAGLRLWF